VINRCTGNGLDISNLGGCTIQGIYIGTNAAGNSASANGGIGINFYNSGSNLIGGTASSAGNLISGNGGSGINITGTAGSSSSGNTVQGNTFGLNAGGAARVANGGIGMYLNAAGTVVGGTSTAARNVIAGSTYENLQFGSGAAGSTLQGNYIGTNAAGATGIKNGGDGVYINGAGTLQVGGTAPQEAPELSGGHGCRCPAHGSARRLENGAAGGPPRRGRRPGVPAR
jgi:hypothetical protein